MDRHLSTLRASNGDENHARELELWKRVEPDFKALASRKRTCPNDRDEQSAKVRKLEAEDMAPTVIRVSKIRERLSELKSERHLAALRSRMSPPAISSQMS